MITTPMEKQRAKSYYLGPHHKEKRNGAEDIKSLGSHSVRIEQKRRSASKFKRDKNLSLEKENSFNHSKFFKAPVKSNKKVHSIILRINQPISQ
jgi:hypothetical protein